MVCRYVGDATVYVRFVRYQPYFGKCEYEGKIVVGGREVWRFAELAFPWSGGGTDPGAYDMAAHEAICFALGGDGSDYPVQGEKDLLESAVMSAIEDNSVETTYQVKRRSGRRGKGQVSG